ncbi:MAG: outer membrane beta-barrel protein [Flavobacterium sp.]
MSKFFSVLSFCLFVSVSFGQNIVLEGNIVEDVTQHPIESATVYVSDAKNSTLIQYTISDKKGKFVLNLKKILSPLTFKISIMGFEEYVLELKSLANNKNFGQIVLKPESKMLGEIIIKSEAPPIRIKKDTLEFNAASFKIRPDSNVQTLLKQLPGVEIDADGKITVNGKEVNQILVNGKPFFDKDGKVALQNLPSEIINKVQVTDTKTKTEELSGQSASSNNASINLTIDEDKNKGYFGKFTGGYGSSERYESSALINYFKNKRKISVLASSNNINSVGFSMDEIFDNMGGGRNGVYSTGNGSFNAGGIQYGGGTGITKSNLVGVSYADEWAKGLDNTTNYFYSNTSNENTNAKRQANFLPDGTFVTTSGYKSKTDRFSNNVNLDFEYKIDSTMTLSVMPKFYKANSKAGNDSYQISEDNNNQLLNESTASTLNNNDVLNFKNDLYFNKSFRKKGRNIGISISNDNTNDQNDNLNKSTTSFYQQQKPDDIRDQKIEQRNLTDNYDFGINYFEPITDSLKIVVGTGYSKNKLSYDTKTFDFDSNSQTYSTQNDLLTNYISSDLSKWKPSVGLSFDKKKFSGQISGGTNLMNYDNHSQYLGNTTDLNKNYIYPHITAYANFKFTKTKSIWSYYSYDSNLPSASQILPVANLANPLNTYIGNQNLNPTTIHHFSFNFYDYDYATRSGYSTWGGFNYHDNQVVASTTYDDNRKATTTYLNVSGTYSSYFGTYWSKTIKREAHKFSFSTGITGNINLSKGFTNAVQYEANTFNIIPGCRVNYDYGEILSITPFYNYTLTNTNYTNYSIDKTSSFVHKFNIQTTNYWPKNWVFGNDLGYTYNSNLSAGFKKDFYLWNTSLAYNFYNKQFTAKVKVYDLLNQNQNATRNITPTTVIDEQNTVLKRYVMFSLTYKLEKFAGKQKPSND